MKMGRQWRVPGKQRKEKIVEKGKKKSGEEQPGQKRKMKI